MKAKQFSIGSYRVDLLRSTITNGKAEKRMEPKVLQVLLFLAENQGEVLTHQQIMKTIWPDVQVIPNALQRCIAQLRKALGDDGKTQQVITTQARIGYCLIATVVWHKQTSRVSSYEELSNSTNLRDEHSAGNIQPVLRKLPVGKSLALVLCLVFISLFVSTFYWLDNKTKPLKKYTKISVQTQSDEHESNPIYTNDGEYIVFNRHVGLCEGNLWAKSTISGKEIRLTKDTGLYKNHSFNVDGSQLTFTAHASCQKQQNLQNACWNIVTIDFANSLTTPQIPQLRLECQANLIKMPKALTNSQYVFLKEQDKNNSLMHYDDRTKTIKVLHKDDVKKISHYDYDPISQRFAVISRQGNHDFIDILSVDGQVTSSNVIKRLPNMSLYQRFEPNFVTGEDYLLTSGYLGPYLLSLTGELSPVEVPEKHIFDTFKRASTNKLLAVRGIFDFDIAEISLVQPNNKSPIGFNQQALPYESFSRTTSSEAIPRYQPLNDAIAFMSNRTGSDQLWLWTGEQATQLTFEENNRSIDNFAWSPNGEKIAYVINDQIALIDLNGDTSKLASDIAVYTVLAWPVSNMLLVTANVGDERSLYQYSIDTQQLTSLNIEDVEKAWLIDNKLLYVTEQNKMWQAQFDQIHETAQLLPDIFAKSSFAKNGYIYYVNPSSRILFKYDLYMQQQTPLIRLKDKAWWIEDIKENRILISQTVAVKKDVIELN